jgi:hypothetical protein
LLANEKYAVAGAIASVTAFFQTYFSIGITMADKDINDIWDECDREIESLRKVAANNQLGFEETIGNLAALKLLSDSSVEEAVKN